MNAETRRANLNLAKVRGLRMLQSLRVGGSEAHGQLGAELNNDAVVRAIIMRGDSPETSPLQLLCARVYYCKIVTRYCVTNFTACHEFPPMPYNVSLHFRSVLAESDRVLFAKIYSFPEALLHRKDS